MHVPIRMDIFFSGTARNICLPSFTPCTLWPCMSRHLIREGYCKPRITNQSCIYEIESYWMSEKWEWHVNSTRMLLYHENCVKLFGITFTGTSVNLTNVIYPTTVLPIIVLFSPATEVEIYKINIGNLSRLQSYLVELYCLIRPLWQHKMLQNFIFYIYQKVITLKTRVSEQLWSWPLLFQTG